MTENPKRLLETARLRLEPFTLADFEFFVSEMLPDPRVVEFYHSYRTPAAGFDLRAQARKDFWNHFEESRALTGFEVWALRERQPAASAQAPLAGWAGLLHTGLSNLYGGPELLQYMLAGHAQGKGYATEAAGEVLRDAASRYPESRVIAVVDIPNAASIKVLDKLGFRKERQIEAYGSPEMYLFSRELHDSE